MAELTFEQLIDKAGPVLTSPQTSVNADSLTTMLKQGEQVLDFANKLLGTLDKFGIRGDLLLRIIAKKLNVDLNEKLPEPPAPVLEHQYPSATHKLMYDELSKISEEDLKKQITAQQEATKK